MQEKTVIVVLRLAGFLIMVLGLWALISSVVQSWGQLDLVYIDLFFRSRLAPPVVAIALGAAVWLTSRRLARWFIHDVS